MKNSLEINGHTAIIAYDPDIEMFRGEFVGLNGGADFYAKDIKGLKREGAISLKVFLDACAKDGLEPRKGFSGRFLMRLDRKTHEAAAMAAAAEGRSLTQWAADAIRSAMDGKPGRFKHAVRSRSASRGN